MTVMTAGHDAGSARSAGVCSARRAMGMSQVSQLPTIEAFRRAMGRFATGVTVLTTRGGGHDHAMTANAVTSV